MTHRTTAPVSFTTAQGRKLVAEFSAGHLTSDAGLVAALDAATELTPDIDATDDPMHGLQERHFFHGDDHHCFLPLYVTRGSRLLVACGRPTSAPTTTPARSSGCWWRDCGRRGRA